MFRLLLEFIALLCNIMYDVLVECFRLIVPRPKKSVKGEIVLITGAASGLGRLLALKFAQIGAKVVCCDINDSSNNAVVEEIKALGGEAYGLTFDCSSRNEVYAAAEKIRANIGHVTILVNNAGVVTGKRFLNSPDSLIDKTFRVNTMAHFWTTKAFITNMVEKNHGHLVYISSIAGYGGAAGLCDYSSSKFGVVGFAESLLLELVDQKLDGVKTTLVGPYFINTGMFDGIKTRFPSLFPILDPEWTAEQIMNGILRNRYQLLLPRRIGLLLVLKSLLPTKSMIMIANFVGFTSSMHTFRGKEVKKTL